MRANSRRNKSPVYVTLVALFRVIYGISKIVASHGPYWLQVMPLSTTVLLVRKRAMAQYYKVRVGESVGRHQLELDFDRPLELSIRN